MPAATLLLLLGFALPSDGHTMANQAQEEELPGSRMAGERDFTVVGR